MLPELASIFLNVVTPVFALVLIGSLAGRWLALDTRTLTRFAYFLLTPAFVFNIIGKADVSAALALRMIGFIAVVEIGLALLGFVVARLLGRPRKMVGAYILIAVFGNVGNFGLPLIEFRLGPEALIPATVYFVSVSMMAFTIGVAAATGSQGRKRDALLSVIKTPALIALPFALAFSAIGGPPLFLERITGLLGGAMVPTMLVTLGVQLTQMKNFHFSADMFIASGVRLLGGPLLAFLLVIPFGLAGLERGAGILQASMPAAVLASIIALEHDLLPDFVTPTVLLSTLLSLVTLTVLMVVI
ncbi:MAG: AEC family transporter [Caldilineaceae bacterium]|nr:AEC family transporter [Caldilineaceae bacterium]